MRFAVSFLTGAVAIPIVGDILTMVSAVGLIFGLFFIDPWSVRSRRQTSTVLRADCSTVVGEEAAVVSDRPSR
jgi:hypothetical protein